MSYSIIGFLSVIIHLIVNNDVFRKREGSHFPTRRHYYRFLLSVIAYHLTDTLWGLLYERHLVALLHVDTALYFALMALSVLLWSDFVVRYLKEREETNENKFRFGAALRIAGHVFFLLQILALAANFFYPVFFSIRSDGEYVAGIARYVAFALQILMFFLTAVYTLLSSDRTEERASRRYFTIGFFGVVMIFAIEMQIYFPLWPFYSMGYMLGCCALHAFVVEDEKAEYLRALEESLNREAMQQRELGMTKYLAYTDPLTGVKSKYAYLEAAERLNSRILSGEKPEFALAVFDVNDLKRINDTFGHKAGDQYLIAACEAICNVFKRSPVFRIGGDEFASILEGKDYARRETLITGFNGLTERNKEHNRVVIAVGIAEFEPGRDNSFSAVFQRADQRMYERKRLLKGDAPIR